MKSLKLMYHKATLPLLIVMLSLLCILSVLLYKEKTAKRVETFSTRYPLIDISRNYVSQEHFIVNMIPLRDQLEEFLKEYNDNISLYVEFLNTGAQISFNPEKRIYPASLVKLPIAVATMKKVERGEWKLSNELVLFEQDKDQNYGDLYSNPIGTRFTIETLLSELLSHSDNTAYRILFRNLGEKEIEQYIQTTGLQDVFDKNFNVSAREYSRLFRTLYTSSYLEPQHSQQLLQTLAQQEKNIYLSAGIPESVTFSHKFGESKKEGSYADSGIVFIPHRPILITFFYQGTGKTGEKVKVEKIYKEVAAMIYEYFK